MELANGGIGYYSLFESQSIIFAANGKFISTDSEQLCFVTQNGISFYEFNSDFLNIKLLMKIPLDVDVHYASLFPNSLYEEEMDYNRIILLTRDDRLIICSFIGKTFKTRVVKDIKIPGSAKGTYLLNCLQDYFVLFIYPSTLFIIINDDSMEAIPFDIPGGLSPSSMSSSGNVLYMNSITDSLLYKVDIDEFYSYMTMPEEEKEALHPPKPEERTRPESQRTQNHDNAPSNGEEEGEGEAELDYDEEEEQENNFFIDIFNAGEDSIDYVLKTDTGIYLFATKTFIHLANDGELVKEYNVDTEGICVFAFQQKEDLMYVFYDQGQIYKFENGEFSYFNIGSIPFTACVYDENNAFLPSRTGASIYLQNGEISHDFSSHVVESICVMPESDYYPMRLISSGGELSGSIVTTTKCIERKAEKEIEIENCTGLFKVYNTIICSFEKESLIFGERIDISNVPTVFAANIDENRYLQVTKTRTLFFDMKGKGKKEFNSLEELNDNKESLHCYNLNEKYYSGCVSGRFIFLFKNKRVSIFESNETGIRFCSSLDMESEIACVTANAKYLFVSSFDGNMKSFDITNNFQQKEASFFPEKVTSMIFAFKKFLLAGTNVGVVYILDENLKVIHNPHVSFSQFKFSQANAGRSDEKLLAISDPSYQITYNEEKDKFDFTKFSCNLFNDALYMGNEIVVATNKSIRICSTMEVFDSFETVSVLGSAHRIVPLSPDRYVVLIEDDVSMLTERPIFGSSTSHIFEFQESEIISTIACDDELLIAVGHLISDASFFNEVGFIYIIDRKNLFDVIKKIDVPYCPTDVIIHNKLIYISVGSSLNVYKFLDKDLKLVSSVQTKTVTYAMKYVDDHIFVFDTCRSLSIYKIDGTSLKFIATDNRHNLITAGTFIGEGKLLLSDSSRRLIIARIDEAHSRIEYQHVFQFEQVFNDFTVVDPKKLEFIVKDAGERMVIGCTTTGAVIAFTGIEEKRFKFLKEKENQHKNKYRALKGKSSNKFVDLSFIYNIDAMTKQKCFL